jgi:carbon storage regulator
MLVLSRKQGESIRINDNVTITVVSVGQGRVKLSIDAPRDVLVLREELCNGQSTGVLSDLPGVLVVAD